MAMGQLRGQFSLAAFLFRTYLFRRIQTDLLSSTILILAIASITTIFLSLWQASEASKEEFRRALEPLAGSSAIILRSATEQKLDFHLSALSAVIPDDSSFVRIREYGPRPQEGRGGELLYLELLDFESLLFANVTALEAAPGLKELISTKGGKSADYLSELFSQFRKSKAVVVFSPDQAKRLPQLSPKHPGQASVALFSEGNSKRLREQVADYQLFNAAELRIESQGTAAEKAQGLLSAFSRNIFVLTFSAILVTGFVVFQLLQVRQSKQTEVIQTLRTLGLSGRQVFLLIVSEGLLFGFFAGALGIFALYPLADIVFQAYVKTTAELYGLSYQLHSGVEPLSLEALMSLLFAAALGAAGSLTPALEARTIRPAIQRMFIKSWRSSSLKRAPIYLVICLFAFFFLSASSEAGVIRTYFSCLLLLPVTFFASVVLCKFLFRVVRPVIRIYLGGAALIGNAQLTGGGLRYFSLVSICSLSLALVYGMGVLFQSFQETLDEWMETTLAADFFIQAPMGAAIEQELIRAIEKRSDVDYVSPVRFDREFINGTPAQIVILPSRTYQEYWSYPFLSGESFQNLGATEVVISESASRKMAVTVSDTISLLGTRFVVRGVVRDYSSEHGLVFIQSESVEDLPLSQRIAGLSIFLKEGVPTTSLRRQLEGDPEAAMLSLSTNKELKEEVQRVFRQTFSLTLLLRFVMLVVAILGFGAIFYQELWARRKLYETLELLGMSSGQLLYSFLFEALLLYLPIVVLGALTGTALGYQLLLRVTPLSFGWGVGDRFFAPFELLGVAFVMLLAVGLSALVPYLSRGPIFQAARSYSE